MNRKTKLILKLSFLATTLAVVVLVFVPTAHAQTAFTGAVNRTYTFQATATDPESDPIYYTFSWGDGSPQTRVPTSGTVASGTQVNGAHLWSAVGAYTVYVVTCDVNNNCSPQSEIVTANIQLPSMPGPITLSSGTNPSTTGTFTLTWTASNPHSLTSVPVSISQYYVWRQLNAGAPSQVGTVTGTTYSENNLSPDGTYTYYVIAEDNTTPTPNLSLQSDSFDVIVNTAGGGTPPTANFDFCALSSDTIQFQDLSTDSDGTVTAWSWNFGDGSANSALRHPLHNFTTGATSLTPSQEKLASSANPQRSLSEGLNAFAQRIASLGQNVVHALHTITTKGRSAVLTLRAFFTGERASAQVGWWGNNNYSYRQRITVGAGATAIPNGYSVRMSVNHANLVSAGKAQADGDDMRIVYWNGSVWQEISRVLANGSSWNNASTQIMFNTQAAISAGGSDNNYYLYYGYGSATAPPTSGVSPARFYKAESLGETTTSSTTYNSKVQLQFTPASASEHWVVVASWRQRHVGSSGTQVDLGQAQIRLNGSTRTGTDAITYRMSGDVWKTNGALFKITGTTAQQTVNLDFRAVGGTDGLDNARIISFQIPDPANANIQYLETLAQTTDIVNPTNAQTLTFTPTSAGDYIWMVSGFTHEGPGGATNGGLSALDENSIVQQTTEESYIGESDGFVPLVHFERRNLTPGSRTFTIRNQPDTTNGSARQGLTQLLFRADVFGAGEAADSASVSQTTQATYQSKASLTTASVSAAQDYVYLAIMNHDDSSGGSLTLSEFAEVRLDGTQQLEDEKAISRNSYDTQIVWANVENSAGDRTIDTRFRSEAGVTAEAKYAHIISLRYKEPSAALGGEETPAQPPQAPWWTDGTGTWTRRRQITFANSAREAFTNYPVLVKLVGGTNIDYTQTQNAGQDIRFVDANAAPGDPPLAHEIEQWDETGGTSYVWVRVPTIDQTNTDSIWMYYGNSGATDQQNAAGVWDTNFKLVHHLKETSGQHQDSTANSNNSTAVTVTTQGSATGKINGTDDFDGVDDLVTIADSASLDIGAGNATWEAWVAIDSNSTFDGIMSHTNGTTATDGWWMTIFPSGVANFAMNDSDHQSNPLTWTSGTLYYVTVVKSGTSISFYRNGVFLNTVNNGQNINNSAGTFRIGLEGSSYGTQYLDGRIDEVRLSSTARSANWIDMTYDQAQDTVNTYDAEESAPVSDTTPPSVSITNPANGATVSGTQSVDATASDNVGVVGVQFKLDGANLGTEDTSSPYSISWDTTSASNGAHTLTAVARDAAGNSTTSAGVNVTVNNVAGPPYSVSLTVTDNNNQSSTPFVQPNVDPATAPTCSSFFILNSAVADRCNRVGLAWSAAKAASSYTVYRRTCTNPPACTTWTGWTPAQPGIDPGTACNLSGCSAYDNVTQNTTYQYYLVANLPSGTTLNNSTDSDSMVPPNPECAGSWSGAGAPLECPLSAATGPCSPSVTPLPATSACGAITLQWSTQPGALSYRVWRTIGADDFPSATVVSPPGLTDLAYTDRNIVPDVTYYYYVSDEKDPPSPSTGTYSRSSCFRGSRWQER